MKFKVGEVVQINRPNVKISVSDNIHGGIGQITEIEKDGTARVRTNKTFFNDRNWESLSWLNHYKIT
jgi:hypothetical protein